MSTEPPKMGKPPGFLWIVILGVVGFCAGFFGPLIFSPEANQGPLVGILMTGPGGAVLGVLLFVLMKFLPVPARAQWIALAVVSVAATLVIFYFVQPEPVIRGYILEVAITGTRTPGAAADDVIADWKKQITQVTWAAPRAGWEPQMRAALAQDRGLVIDAVLVRQRAIKMQRKFWKKGELFATGWEPVNEKRSYYVRAGDPLNAISATAPRLFIEYDSAAPIRAPDIWPPQETERFIGFSRVTAIPTAYEKLP